MNAPTYRRACESEVAGIIAERREPLEVERLLDSDARRVEVATGASRPLPVSHDEEIADLLDELRAAEPQPFNPKRKR